ncbi:DUF881 domain-containing protein [uncultured Nocardioides sp.]|uniref:DUF881 domain-containing protein n=1 Tax=uncultured Nocardioides sp. TaxID=198441 RepID=UPI002630080C|nr:DUF881 domain-containing protein [uncultured Nocardioides sp.]
MPAEPEKPPKTGPEPDSGFSDGPATPRRSGWRWATPLALAVCGGLVVTSAANSDGTDLRPGRYADLGSVVRAENREVDALQDRARDLTEEVADLGRAGGDRTARRYRDRSARVRGVAGLEPVTGEGVTVTLADAPDEVAETSEIEPNRLVVHQQDLQAVVNALWRGGAEAITLEGRRIVSTTGIKCAGSVVQLQGLVFPEPYTIEAVGPAYDMVASLDADDAVTSFRVDAARPDVAVGYDVQLDSLLTAPPYEGVVTTSYAEPMD